MQTLPSNLNCKELKTLPVPTEIQEYRRDFDSAELRVHMSCSQLCHRAQDHIALVSESPAGRTLMMCRYPVPLSSDSWRARGGTAEQQKGEEERAAAGPWVGLVAEFLGPVCLAIAACNFQYHHPY